MIRIAGTAFLLIPLLANAQFKKGDKFLEGSFTLNTQRSPDPLSAGINKVNSFSINPSMGLLITEKIAIGGQLGYSTYHQKAEFYPSTISEYKANSFSIGAFLNRFFTISEKFLFSIDGNLTFQRGSVKNESNSYNNKFNFYQLDANIRPTFIFFPSPKWGIETSIATVSYSHNRNLSSDAKQNNFYFNYGVISLGVSYYIRKPE